MTVPDTKSVSMNTRPVLLAMYPLAFAIFWVPLIDLIAGAVPIQPGNMSWRFTVIGLLLKSMLVPMLGLTLAVGIATFTGQRRVLRVFSVLALSATVLLVGLAVLFTLDYAQLRGNLAPELRPGINRAVITALMVAALQLPVAIGLGIGGWKVSRKPPSGREPARNKRDVGLIVSPHPTPKESAT